MTGMIQKNAVNKVTSMPYLQIDNVTKKFGDFVALDDVSLSVNEGEFVCFLGPSGCGKTTLLRAIAGLDFQSEGRIVHNGKDISHLPPVQRDFGIVFQSYALFPNLTVAQNISYGLSVRKLGRDAVNARVDELLETVGLPGSGQKYPSALSGGQQQRIALARALANQPGLLLLDEPLSALDAKVRIKLRHEMKELQRQIGITTIMVTHDQEEALSLADRIVVMNHGIIEQIGTPTEIYRDPASAYIADFIGEMNFLDATVLSENQVSIGNYILDVDQQVKDLAVGEAVTVCIRPEDVMVRGVTVDTQNSLNVEVVSVEFLGSFFRAELCCHGMGGDTYITADFSSNLMRDHAFSKGDHIKIALPRIRSRVFAGDKRKMK